MIYRFCTFSTIAAAGGDARENAGAPKRLLSTDDAVERIFRETDSESPGENIYRRAIVT